MACPAKNLLQVARGQLHSCTSAQINPTPDPALTLTLRQPFGGLECDEINPFVTARQLILHQVQAMRPQKRRRSLKG